MLEPQDESGLGIESDAQMHRAESGLVGFQTDSFWQTRGLEPWLISGIALVDQEEGGSLQKKTTSIRGESERRLRTRRKRPTRESGLEIENLDSESLREDLAPIAQSIHELELQEHLLPIGQDGEVNMDPDLSFFHIEGQIPLADGAGADLHQDPRDVFRHDLRGESKQDLATLPCEEQVQVALCAHSLADLG